MTITYQQWSKWKIRGREWYIQVWTACWWSCSP